MDSCVRHGNTQCCLKDLTDLMFSLSPNQKKFLEDIEFHKFIGISYSTNDLPRNLTWELVSLVDVEKGTLEIDGMSFNIEESVQRLLPVPRGSIEYNYKADDSEDDNLFELKDAFSDVGQFRGKGLEASVLRNKLQELNDREPFLQHFILLILFYYLAPSCNVRIDRNFIRLVQNVDRIKEWNWSKIIADHLISGIVKFRGKKPRCKNLPKLAGCVHILLVSYSLSITICFG